MCSDRYMLSEFYMGGSGWGRLKKGAVSCSACSRGLTGRLRQLAFNRAAEVKFAAFCTTRTVEGSAAGGRVRHSPAAPRYAFAIQDNNVAQS